jgi:hypothetical protein
MGSNGLIKTNDGGGTLVNMQNLETEIPQIFTLYQNYPNPFNPRTIINYELSKTSYIKLKVFDIEGKELVELVNEKQNQGKYKVSFDGSGLPSGVYFYRLEISNRENRIISETKKMILLR